MFIRTVMTVLISCTLAACSLGPHRVWTNYGLQHHAASTAAATNNRLPVTLKVAAVDAPDWLNTRAMYYRLLYSDSDRIAAYSKSRWLASPPKLIGNALINDLSHAGRWQAVVSPDADASADYTLHMHLTRFEQDFKSSKRSVGVITARVSLIDNHKDSVVAQKRFRYAVPAPSANAQGGVSALTKASQQLLSAVQGWLKNIPLSN